MRFSVYNCAGSTPVLQLWLAIGFCGLLSIAQAAPQNQTAPTTDNKTRTELNKITSQSTRPLYPQTITGANRAYRDKNYQAALTILLKLEGDYAGRVEYDYLLGRCALATKQHDVAIAAFTRALTVDPNFAAARFELARTYYSKGVVLLARSPFEQARAEFSLVTKMDPPAELLKAIAGYQANIDKYLKEREAEFDVHVELAGGYDSNVATRSSNHSFSYYDSSLPGTRTYTLQDPDFDNQSVFTQIEIGAGIDWPLFSKYFEVFAGLDLGGRGYLGANNKDLTWTYFRFGARHYGKKDKKTIQFSHRKTDIFDNLDVPVRYHGEGRFLLSWEYKNRPNNVLKFFVMSGHSDYHQSNTHTFTVNYDRAGIEMTHLLEGKRKATIEAMLVSGADFEPECNNSSFCQNSYERNVRGLRLGWGINVSESSRLHANIYVENSLYHQQFFFLQRRDHRREIFLAMNTNLGKSWYIRPEIHYSENVSNLSLFEHDRLLVITRVGWSL